MTGYLRLPVFHIFGAKIFFGFFGSIDTCKQEHFDAFPNQTIVNMTMTTPDNTKWIVAICAKVFAKDQISRSELIQLKDPSTAELRQYVLIQNNGQPQIIETQSLEADFSSFLVGRHVVKDGNLYVFNPVDPLFFVLQGSCESQRQSTTWQSFDQTLERLVPDQIVRGCVMQSQLGHLCQTLCNDQTDNVTFFKFSETKALSWLEKKRERVYQCMLDQEKQHQLRRQALLARRPQGSSTNRAGGSVSSTFFVPEDPIVSLTSPINGEEVIPHSTLQRLKMESLQIVCNYLSEYWTEKLIESVKVPQDKVFASSLIISNQATTINTGVVLTSTTTPTKVTPIPMKVEAARSVANKRLEKVSKRGMSALTSFFGPPKKKPAITK